ncbi:putative membrane protein [Handroanthus impetiginosus]|uniref:Vacuolar iron transporter n=1 Tax=Handroanthus impetiginosus TaxID=429701 RepID=A0A2G9HFF4_9LAMI|nr:putative membrane protein [Handroanthus impetiginosus]
MGDSRNNVPLLPPLMDEENERPKEPWKGEFVKSIVYAGLDAIVTSFSLISSISAGRLSSVDVLVLGFANLVADGISMGFGDFVSSSTERDVAVKERSVTEWDVEHHRRNQQHELVQRYQALGMNAGDAAMVVSIFAKYPDILVDEKMAAEKGMLPADQTEKPWKNGLVTFAAFLVFGCAPILAFIILIPFTKSVKIKFIGACVLSALALALLGIAKAKIAGQNYAVSTGITLFNGAVAGAAAYAIGWTLRNVAGLEE